MEISSNKIQKAQVKFNNVVIFSAPDTDTCIDFALMLHRASNEPHSIDVCSKDVTYVALFTRK